MLALLVAASIVASGVAQRVVEENEAQLLADRTAEIQSLLESLGSSLEAQMVSVAAISQVTGGDPAEFRDAVESVAEGVDETSEGGWGLLHRTPEGWLGVATVGAPAVATDLPETWSGGLDRAASGQLTVLGFLGEGLTRSLVLATGRTGTGGDLVVYLEVSLVGAATTSASEADDPLAGVAIEVFIGTEPDPANLLLAFGQPDEGREERRVVDVKGLEVLLEVSATGPLGGELASQLPNLLLGGGAALGLAIASVVEMSQRRRDDAMATVRDLEHQNRLLDRALADQQAAETARAAMEVELRQAQRLEAVGHLAGGVAHDFNNVLAAILSYADLAADAVTDPGALADLEAIRGAARRGAGLTRQLLQFSRRESGEATVVDVNERIADTVEMLGRTLGEDISLSTSLLAEPATVLADPVELDQIVLNLVVNARDAVAAGGAIVVATERVDLDRTDLAGYASLRPGPHIRLKVTDDGHGMAPDVLEHAFEPFFTTKGRGQGTGLGLSTVYGIVQRHGGHVAAKSVPGKGTTVEVLLPARAPGVVAAGASLTAEPARTGSARTVLVVEDEEPLRSAMRRMLVRAGFTVLDAADGRSALDLHGGADIDLLLTDLVMPGAVTGVDVAAAFRSRVPDLPVLYVTGYSDEILDPGHLDGSTATALLSKPFTEADLLEVVGATLGAAR